jgi:hypothetical protein
MATTLFAYGIQANGTFGTGNNTAYPTNDTDVPSLCTVSVIMAKSVITNFYEKPIRYSYYSGCSSGRYQGLNRIQTHTDSFDGALIDLPAVRTLSIARDLPNNRRDAMMALAPGDMVHPDQLVESSE